MATLSSFVGIKKPLVSIYSESTRLAQVEVSTGQVLGAFAEEAFQGEGTLFQDSRALEFEAAIKQAEQPLKEEDWKSGEHFRKGLNFHEGMDNQAAQILAETEDDRQERQLIIGKASGWQTAGGFGVALAAGVVEPKNLASGVAAAVLTGGIGAVAVNSMRIKTLLKSFNTIGKYKRVAAIAAAEGFTAAAITEPSNRESSKTLQGDYTMADTLMNFGLSTILGAGFGVAGRAIKDRGRGKRLAEIKAYRAEREDIAVKEFDTALGQMAEGKAVDVEAIAHLENANRVKQLTTLEPDRIQFLAESNVVERKKGKFEVRLDEEAGALQGAVGRGKTAKEAIDDIVGQYQFTRPILEGEHTKIDPSIFQDISEIHRLEGILKDTPARFEQQLKAAGLHLDTFAKLTDKLKAAKEDLALFKSTSKGRQIEKKMRLTGESPAQVAEQARAELKAISGKKIATVSRNLNNERKSIQAKIKQLQEKVKSQQVSSAITEPSVQRLVKDAGKPGNSTAYNPKDSLEVDEYLKEAGTMEDQIRMEQEFEGYKEELQQLESQGLLNKEELRILEDLAQVEADSAIFDNILLNAKICLTRG